jgi:hypothetical protein
MMGGKMRNFWAFGCEWALGWVEMSTRRRSGGGESRLRLEFDGHQRFSMETSSRIE